MRLAVRLTPRGGRDAVEGLDRDEADRPLLKARVAAPPVEGEANAALVRLVAKTLGLPRSGVRVVSGETARVKLLDIAMDEDEVLERLSAQ
ncbi:MAG TPA: DUF167 family protein [Caulobacteraceae bacterium]|nr:DUF167 family protein [Caulobacteraceae bacterium]